MSLTDVAWQFAGSLAAVGLLVLLARAFGFAGRPILQDEDEARALADDIPGGFDAVAVSLDPSRGAALLRDATGRVAIVAPRGAHFVTRQLGPDAKAACVDGKLLLRDGDLSAELELGAAASDWAEAIAALE